MTLDALDDLDDRQTACLVICCLAGRHTIGKHAVNCYIPFSEYLSQRLSPPDYASVILRLAPLNQPHTNIAQYMAKGKAGFQTFFKQHLLSGISIFPYFDLLISPPPVFGVVYKVHPPTLVLICFPTFNLRYSLGRKLRLPSIYST